MLKIDDFSNLTQGTICLYALRVGQDVAFNKDNSLIFSPLPKQACELAGYIALNDGPRLAEAAQLQEDI